MPLSDDEINALLKKDLVKAGATGPRPIQLGPLSWVDTPNRCSSRGCGSPCLIKVEGIPYCSSHALTVLNRIIVRELWYHVNLDECTCNAGKHSNGNIHTYDCSLYKLTGVQV